MSSRWGGGHLALTPATHAGQASRLAVGQAICRDALPRFQWPVNIGLMPVFSTVGACWNTVIGPGARTEVGRSRAVGFRGGVG